MNSNITSIHGLNLLAWRAREPLEIRCGWSLAIVIGRTTAFVGPHRSPGHVPVDAVCDWEAAAFDLGLESEDDAELPLAFVGTTLSEAWQKGRDLRGRFEANAGVAPDHY
ncbi:hypothetical protein [Paraburkholderia youngii]|uniref:hypothetical protein n=1 Tax=Paraburkholderia youngii TaxID=2782701 RepID=UPI003D1F2B64